MDIKTAKSPTNSNIREFPVASPVNEDLIADLEKLLQQAKDGELVGIAGAMIFSKNRSGYFWNFTERVIPLLGELSLLRYKIESISEVEES